MEIVKEYSEKDPPPSLSESCRCCLVESSSSKLCTDYFWNGKRVVYADLLMDTFGLTLSSSLDLNPAICEACITRLIDATEFKKQIQECDATLNKQLICASKNRLTTDSDLMLESWRIKEEAISIDDDNYNEPLHSEILRKLKDTGLTVKREGITKTVKNRLTLNNKSNTIVKKKYLVPASKLKDIPGIPATSDLKSLKIGNKTIQVKVHSTNPRSLQQVTSKYYNNVVRSNTSNVNHDNKVVRETQHLNLKKKPSTKGLDHRNANVPYTIKKKENSELIVLHTTAYPFRFPMPYLNVACVYCTEENIEPANYRAHVDKEHPNKVDPHKANSHLGARYAQLKVECSDLKCRICNKSFNTLETIAKHLNEDHEKKIDFTVDLGVAPFKFNKNEVFTCAVCGKQFAHLNTLSKHTTTHYSRFICDICGKGYSCPSILRHHQKFGHVDKPICTRCKSTFESRDELTTHRENSVKCQPYVCNECNERFAKLCQRRHHMIAVHGKKPRVYKCFICQQEFTSTEVYSLHIAKNHAAEIGAKCDICDKKFLHQHEVRQHMSTHTGATPYQCEECGKAYASRKTLTQHVRINHKHHYSCDECKKHFGCKSSLLNHNATRH